MGTEVKIHSPQVSNKLPKLQFTTVQQDWWVYGLLALPFMILQKIWQETFVLVQMVNRCRFFFLLRERVHGGGGQREERRKENLIK